MPIEDRKENLKLFECSRKYIIATTFLERGVNFDVNVVINYGLMKNSTGGPRVISYLYRSSRCGRFGSKGVCITFEKGREMRKLANAANINIKQIKM